MEDQMVQSVLGQAAVRRLSNHTEPYTLLDELRICLVILCEGHPARSLHIVPAQLRAPHKHRRRFHEIVDVRIRVFLFFANPANPFDRHCQKS